MSPKNSWESWLFYPFKVLTGKFNNPAPPGNKSLCFMIYKGYATHAHYEETQIKN